MAKWKCEEKVDALYAGGRPPLISSIHKRRTRSVARAQATVHKVLDQDDLIELILQQRSDGDPYNHFRNEPSGPAAVNTSFLTAINRLRPSPPNYDKCMRSVDTTMRTLIANMKMPQSVRNPKVLNIRKILQKVTASVAGVDESTCFPTLCTWLITHKGELVDVKSINLTIIDLSDKSENMNHFANVLRNGALATLTSLDLGYNQIGDEGTKVFSTALSSGALANLTKLDLTFNQIGDEGMQAFSTAISSGSLGSLQFLNLDGNQISDAGMKSFSDAIAMGSLASLQALWLNGNQIGDEGMKAFSSALSSGALVLPKLAEVFVLGNPGDKTGMKKACSARGIQCHA